MNIEIKEMSSEDFLKTYKTILECLGGTFDNNITYYRYHDDFSLIAKCNDEVIGHVLIQVLYNTFTNKKTFFLQDVCVLEEYRKNGIGTRLIEKVFEYANNDKLVNRIILTSNNKRIEAHKLYKKFGFSIKDTNLFVKYFN